jgi:hypothetical protein
MERPQKIFVSILSQQSKDPTNGKNIGISMKRLRRYSENIMLGSILLLD